MNLTMNKGIFLYYHYLISKSRNRSSQNITSKKNFEIPQTDNKIFYNILAFTEFPIIIIKYNNISNDDYILIINIHA